MHFGALGLGANISSRRTGLCRSTAVPASTKDGVNAVPKSSKKQRKSKQKKTTKATGQQNGEGESSLGRGQEIRQERINKVAKLAEVGEEAFAYTFGKDTACVALHQRYDHLEAGDEVPDVVVSVAGRVLARRDFGKLTFVRVEDQDGEIQLFVDKKLIAETQPNGYRIVKELLDVGDIVGATGWIKKTNKGELSVVVQHLRVLTKSIQMLPDKFHGVTDDKIRLQRRYLDMIVSPKSRATIATRARVVARLRRYLEEQGFLEMETPVLEAICGGAEAKPFITYHNSLHRTFYLRIATELHLKRLLVGGFERVFEIGRVFRNEGISPRHNPEFTSLELYQAYADYTRMMEVTEELFREAAMEACGQLCVEYNGASIDLGRTFARCSMASLVAEATGLPLGRLEAGMAAAGAPSVTTAAAATAAGAAPEVGRADAEGSPLGGTDVGKELAELRDVAVELVTQRGCAEVDVGKVSAARSMGEMVNELFEVLVESTLIQPTFVTEHPVEVSPLAKRHRSKAGVTERFELYVGGHELANSFSELTDPIEQRYRFEQQVDKHRREVELSQVQQVDQELQSNSVGQSMLSGGEGQPGDIDTVVGEETQRGTQVEMHHPSGPGGGVEADGETVVVESLGQAVPPSGIQSTLPGERENSNAQKQSAAELLREVQVDEDFLLALEYGMPPTAGLGIGVDRLIMLLTNNPSIKEVIAFPKA